MQHQIVFILILVTLPFCVLHGDIFQIVESQNLQSLSVLTNDIKQINSVNNFGDTPLMIAARMGNVEMVRMLVDAGADIDACNKGFTVKEQIESYLRRTGDSRKGIESV